jgi:hypothetical protein
MWFRWSYSNSSCFSQISAQLTAANPEVLNNIIFQDPMLLDDWKAVFENHGGRVVQTPAAFKVVGKNTSVFSPFVEPQYLLPGLKDQPVDRLAMFVGNGIRLIVNESKSP